MKTRVSNLFLIFFVAAIPLAVVGTQCNQAPAKTATEVADVLSLSLEEFECLETTSAQDTTQAVTGCLGKDLSNPALVDLATQLFGQRKMAEKSGFMYKRILSQDGGK